jgi:FKBP-type peptidyl-prolyl cis-trans isomerase SlyD
VELEPKDAFGERKEDLVKLIPLSYFKDSEPTVGGYVSLNNFRGRVLSINGGRVKVDFNHPLAGKTLQYEIEILRQVTEMQEKLKCIVNYFTGLENSLVETKVDGEVGEVRIKNHQELPKNLKDLISEVVFKYIDGIKELRFIDVYNK